MLVPAELSELTKQHPYFVSFITWLSASFVRSKAPAWKKAVERGIMALGDLNHTLCQTIRRCRKDWRSLFHQIPHDQKAPVGMGE
jgi:hypothetical protein